ncbi:MAG: sugar phosphate isomerase/epimerase family protein [Candidatus Bathyarchaeia archaeon]
MMLGVSTLALYREKRVSIASLIESNVDIDRWEILDEGFNRLTQEQIKGLMSLQTDKDLSVHAPFSSINIAEPTSILRRSFTKVLSRSLKNAYKIGAKAWILHPGNYSPFTIHFPELARNKSIDLIKKLLKEAENYSITLYIENLPGKEALLNNLKTTWSFLEELNEDVRLCLDIGHANLFEGPEAFIERLRNRIGYIHSHDNIKDSDRHLPVGEGTVSWDRVTNLLKEIGYNGWVIVENLSMEDSRKSLGVLLRLLST